MVWSAYLTMNTFDKLPLDERLALLRIDADLITVIQDKKLRVALYRLDNFLVEEYYDHKAQRITKVASVKYLDLVKYIPFIKISSIYNLIAH